MALEPNAAVKEMVTNELSTIIEESLHDILKWSIHTEQRQIQSVVYSIVWQVMLDLVRKDIPGQKLDAHIANHFDHYAAAEGLKWSVLPLSWFVRPIATSFRCETDTVMKKGN